MPDFLGIKVLRARVGSMSRRISSLEGANRDLKGIIKKLCPCSDWSYHHEKRYLSVNYYKKCTCCTQIIFLDRTEFEKAIKEKEKEQKEKLRANNIRNAEETLLKEGYILVYNTEGL